MCMVNDIIEELLGLDMDSKPESLWWTSTYKDEDVATLEVESRKKLWDLPFMEVFDVLDTRCQRDGKGMQRTEEKPRKGWDAGGVTGTLIARKLCLFMTECPRVISHVFCSALNGSVNWLWSAARATKTHNWMSKILRLTFRVGMRTGTWVEYKKRTSQTIRTKWRKLSLPTMVQTIAEHIWKAMSWAAYDGDVPVVRALRSILGWRTTTWWRTRNAWDTLVTRWAGEENDRAQWMVRHPLRKDDVIVALMRMLRHPTTHPDKKRWHPQQKGERSRPPWYWSSRRTLKALSWRSGMTARRWQIGLTATQSKERHSMLFWPPRNN